MKYLLSCLVLIITMGTAQAVCLTEAAGNLFQCDRYPTGDSFCIRSRGLGFLAYKTDEVCTKKMARRTRTDKPEEGIIGDTQSLVDEFDAQLSQIDKMKGDELYAFGGNERGMRSFKEKAIVSLLKKMTTLADMVYNSSLVNVSPLSSQGKQILVNAARYLSFLQRIHILYVKIAHRSLTGQKYFDYDELKKYRLKLKKKFALIIYAKVSFASEHLDEDTIRFSISQDEKQKFEEMAIAKPSTMQGYGKLVQYMAIKEQVVNRWAIQRMSTKKMDDPALSQCANNFLSFRPKEDGSYSGKYKAKRMGSSLAYKELHKADKFITDYAEVTPKLVDISFKHKLLTRSSSKKLFGKIIKSIPTIMYFLYEEMGYEDEDIDDWTNTAGGLLADNEEKEWEEYAPLVISVSSFEYDDLATTKIVDRIVSETYKIRYEAIQYQLRQIISDDLPLKDINKANALLKDAIDAKRSNWEANYRSALRVEVSKIHKSKTVALKKRRLKEEEMEKAALKAIPAAYLLGEIKKAGKKYDSEEMEKYSKFDSNLLDPKTPEELMFFLMTKLQKSYIGKKIAESINDQKSEYQKSLKEFFEVVSKRFNVLMKKKKNQKLDEVGIAKLLYEIAYYRAEEFQVKYPFDDKDFSDLDPNSVEVMSLNYKPYTIQAGSLYVKPAVTFDLNKTFVTTGDTNFVKSDWLDYKSQSMDFSKDSGRVATDSLYNLYSQVKMDNTYVSQPVAITPCWEEKEKIDPIYNSAYTSKGEFFHDLFYILNIKKRPTKGSKKANDSFVKNLGDQEIMAQTYIADAYAAVPLLKVEISTKERVYHATRNGGYYTNVSKKRSAMKVLVQSTVKFPSNNVMKVNRGTGDNFKIKEPKKGQKYRITSLDRVIDQIISQVKTNLQGQMKEFCLADYSRYSTDDRYKTLFKSVTAIRQSLQSDEKISRCDKGSMKSFDTDMKKATRYTNEAINEDYIEPMLMVTMVIFIIATVLFSILGSAGTMTGPTVALLMMIIDGADLAMTGASLYYKGMTNFYEIPAQIKFQNSLAGSQVLTEGFTTFDDVEISRKENNMGKLMFGIEAILAPIIGYQFKLSAKRFIGTWGTKSMRKFGLPTRAYGEAVRSLQVKKGIKQLIKEKGLVRGLIAKTSQEYQNALKWLPRYQPYTADELANTVRNGLVRRAEKIGLSDEPWKLTADYAHVKARYTKRLSTITEYSDDLGRNITKYKVEGSGNFIEMMRNLKYSKAVIITKRFFKSVNQGKVGKFISEFGETTEAMTRLQHRALKKKIKIVDQIVDKLKQTEKLASRGNGKKHLVKGGFKNQFDYFQSLLSKEEIKIFEEVAKYCRILGKKMPGAYKGFASEFREVFKDHNRIMETITPLVSVSGVPLTIVKGRHWYKNAITELVDTIMEESDETAMEAAEKALRKEFPNMGDDELERILAQRDLADFYKSMLKNDGSIGGIEEELSRLDRNLIEEQLDIK